MAQLVSNAGQARSPLMEWSGRAPALPATNTGGGHRRQGARHVTETRHFANRDRHRYRQELVPHRGPRSARRNRAAAEVVTRPGRSTAHQPATVLNRYGGLRRRASSQSQAPNARPRRPTDAREIRAPLTKAQISFAALRMLPLAATTSQAKAESHWPTFYKPPFVLIGAH